jgi:hypothetical protein
MAVNVPELFTDGTATTNGLRFAPTSVKGKQLWLHAGALLLEPGTALGIITATGLWTLWTDLATWGVGTDFIRGFVWPDAVQQHATETVLMNVMMAGTVNYNDIPLNGETAANLKASLRIAAVRNAGFIIEDLDLVQ